MDANLSETEKTYWHYTTSGEKVFDKHNKLSVVNELCKGDVSGLRGKADKIKGFVNVYGDVSKLEDDLSAVYGHINEDLSGNIKNMAGDASNKYGKIHIDAFGDWSNISGDITGVYGDFTGKIGNIDDCNLSNTERKNGVDISTLIGN